MLKLLTTLLGLLTNRLLLSIVGLVLICLLVWYPGRSVTISGIDPPLADDTPRLVAIIVVVFAWALYQIVKLSRARQTNAVVIEKITAAPRAPAQGEVDVLRQKFKDAATALKTARFGKAKWGRKLFYQLPWYVIIGPPGAGKTTAIRHSGLEFPLAREYGDDPLRGVGGTRNCDWWFSEEAVFLDTAGRYAIQDGKEPKDAAAFKGFLELLRKHRRWRPIDGIIVAFSLPHVMSMKEAERAAHAQQIRSRIKEFSEELKVRAPIYVVLTKCDLIEGFVEYFDGIQKGEREQVLGFTFPLAASEAVDEALAQVPAHCDALVERLSNRLVDRLARERDPQRAALIIAFPKAFESSLDALQQLLSDAFRPSRLDPPVLLRGVYFTSGTQEGTAIERIFAAISDTLGVAQRRLPAFAGSARAYFIGNLLKQVVLRETSLVGATNFFARNRVLIKRLAYGGAAAFSALLVSGWLLSYVNNGSRVAQYEAIVNDLKRENDALSVDRPDMGRVVAYLDRLRDLPGGFQSGGVGFFSSLAGLGLDQGSPLGEAAHIAYRDGLHYHLVPLILGGLEEQVRTSSDEKLYNALKVYLMFRETSRMDSELAEFWIQEDWNQRLTGQKDLASRLSTHVNALLNEPPLPPVNLDANLVRGARAELTRVSIADRAYGLLKNSEDARDLPNWSLADVMPAQDLQFFRRTNGTTMRDGIRGFFTLKGYTDFYMTNRTRYAREAVNETWVLGEPNEFGQSADLDAVSAAMDGLYLLEFVEQWKAFLPTLAVVEFRTAPETEVGLRTLSNKQGSPVAEAISKIVAETKLAPSQNGPTLGTATQSTINRLRAVIGANSKANPRDLETPLAAFGRELRPLHQLVEGEQPGINRIIDLLNELYVEFTNLAHESTPNPAANAKSAETLKLEAQRQPLPLNSWLLDVSLNASRRLAEIRKTPLAGNFNADVGAFCREFIANRYPLIANAQDVISVAEFERFFAPGGIVDSFFTKYLADIVDRSTRPWRARAIQGGAQAPISAETLRFFQRSAEIRDAYFGPGGSRLRLEFWLKGAGVAGGAQEALLRVGDKLIKVDTGRSLEAQILWPPQGGGYDVRLNFVTAREERALNPWTGDWALMRFLDAGKPTPTGTTNVYSMAFTHPQGGQSVRYELRTAAASNPIEVERNFSCPERL
jgi:type VI secretion system protein ImpL